MSEQLQSDFDKILKITHFLMSNLKENFFK